MTRPATDRIAGGYDPDPVEARLRALAADRFSARPKVLDGIERRVLARLRESDRNEFAPTSRLARWGKRRYAPERARRPRRASAAIIGVAAALVLAGSTALASAESVPGRPLFGLRLAVEQALLPAQSPSDRLDAQLVRLNLRLTEATEVGSDAGAARDAVRAYRATLPELRTLLRDAPANARVVKHSLRQQLRTIDSLKSHFSAQAWQDLDGAAVETRAVLASLPDEDGKPARDADDRRPGPADRDQ
jgi:hypothetical protein